MFTPDFTLDGSTCYLGVCTSGTDWLDAEIKPMAQGTYMLALCYLKTRHKVTTIVPVVADEVATWLNDKIKTEYSAAFRVEDFQWQSCSQEELIFLRD